MGPTGLIRDERQVKVDFEAWARPQEVDSEGTFTVHVIRLTFLREVGGAPWSVTRAEATGELLIAGGDPIRGVMKSYLRRYWPDFITEAVSTYQPKF